MYIAIPVLIYAGERMFRTIRSEIYNVEVVKVRMLADLSPSLRTSLKLRLFFTGNNLPWEGVVFEADEACRIHISQWHAHICSVP